MRSIVYCVVPVLDEAPNLEPLFDSFRALGNSLQERHSVHVVLVDDGSTDGTAERAREVGTGVELTVLTHAVNRGPGAAFGTAFEFLAGRLAEEDWVVTLEGDNTSRLELLHKMFHRADEPFDVVLASPHSYGGGITNTGARRVLLSAAANIFVRVFLGISGILSVTCFFRLHRTATIRALQQAFGPRIIEREGFEGMTEMVMKMVLLGFTISEVPMVIDTDRRAGSSKMKVGKTIRGFFALVGARSRWASIVSDRDETRARST